MMADPARTLSASTQIAKFMGPTWGPPGSCRPQMGPMLAPWTLLSGKYRLPNLVITLSADSLAHKFSTTSIVTSTDYKVTRVFCVVFMHIVDFDRILSIRWRRNGWRNFEKSRGTSRSVNRWNKPFAGRRAHRVKTTALHPSRPSDAHMRQ